jgi:hypothetical protein
MNAGKLGGRPFWCPERQSFPSSKVAWNEGIATFFDVAALKYLSLLYMYTPLQQISGWNDVATASAKLLHVGTGSGEFEKTVGLAEINGFIESIKGNSDPRACIDWVKDAFGKVSRVAKGVGETPEFLVSTRSARAFKVFA